MRLLNTEEENGKLGFILGEEDTEKVLALSEHLGIPPNAFFSHCIDTLWNEYVKSG